MDDERLEGRGACVGWETVSALRSISMISDGQEGEFAPSEECYVPDAWSECDCGCPQRTRRITEDAGGFGSCSYGYHWGFFLLRVHMLESAFGGCEDIEVAIV